MILLDTNVISEAMTREPHPRLRQWLDAQAAETLFLSSITVAELDGSINVMCWRAGAPATWFRRRGPDHR